MSVLLAALCAGCSAGGDEPVSIVDATTTTTATAATTTTVAAPVTSESAPAVEVRTGARVLVDDGFAPLQGRRVGVVLNAASTVEGRSLLDVLVEAPGVEVAAAYAPEHGIRADAPAGAGVEGATDPATGVFVHSLYGPTREPTDEMLAGVDVLVFDLQDVGTRFYTYISTMGGVMQAAARNGVPLIVLDRPNPLGGELLDGEVLDPAFESFVGRYPIPAVHGMTVGELALAIRGEAWLPGLETLDLRVIAVDGWRRSLRWDDTGLLWLPPSPGLPTTAAVDAYPATVLFEATTLSVARGTDQPFSRVGAPWLDTDALLADLEARNLPGVRFEATSYVPAASAAVPEPEFEGETVNAVAVVVTDPATFRPVATGVHLLEAIRSQGLATGQGEVIDRSEMLDLLAGTGTIRAGIEAGVPAADLVAGWTPALDTFAATRAPYLLYD